VGKILLPENYVGVQETKGGNDDRYGIQMQKFSGKKKLQEEGDRKLISEFTSLIAEKRVAKVAKNKQQRGFK